MELGVADEIDWPQVTNVSLVNVTRGDPALCDQVSELLCCERIVFRIEGTRHRKGLQTMSLEP